MSATAKLFERRRNGGANSPLAVLSASGQLGYGVIEKALKAGMARQPDFIGCDMGSVDPGPAYLGSGEFGTSPSTTERDMRLVLRAARELDVPLIIGTAGTAGARPHLDRTLDIVRKIAREDGMSFKLASIGADMPRDKVKAAVAAGRVRPLGSIDDLTEEEVDASSHLVGQMGTDAFIRALEEEPDVIIAGRACDTAIFTAIPKMLGYPMGLAMHMAKIVECTSLCCTPGGRDAMLGTLDEEGFTLESMSPDRHATPMSVAAHGLYEQADPFSVAEPEGALHLDQVRFEALDEHRTRAAGARWEPALRPSIKLEGARRVGERSVVLAGSSDPRFIAAVHDILPAVETAVRELAPGDYRLIYRVYGLNGVVDWPTPPAVPPREIFVMVECLAEDAAMASTAARAFKQFLLHYGFPGRLSTGGNLAFPFTPPELSAGTAYRFNVYHVMEVDDLAGYFPVTMETV